MLSAFIRCVVIGIFITQARYLVYQGQQPEVQSNNQVSHYMSENDMSANATQAEQDLEKATKECFDECIRAYHNIALDNPLIGWYKYEDTCAEECNYKNK